MYLAIRSQTDNSHALEAARRYSPNIEIVGRTLLIFDITGKEAKKARRIAEEIFDEKDHIAVAASDNLSAAILLARHRRGVSYAAGDDLGDLEAIPVDALEADRDFRILMESWGIGTLGEFKRLPENEMVERFGQAIVPHREEAAATFYRAANWNVREDKFLWSRRLDSEIKTIEPLNFVLSAGVREVFANLGYAGLSTQSSAITLSGREGSRIYKVRIVFPTLNEKLWLKQMVSKVELDPPEFGIELIEAAFEACRSRAVQNNLYSGAILEPENLNLIVSKLKKVVGVKEIGLPKLRDSWSRGFSMTEDLEGLTHDVDEKAGETVFSAFYHYRNPVKARISFENGMPNSLSIKGKKHGVKVAAGPWRTDAEWHEGEKYQRDEWDIETESGAVYRFVIGRAGEGVVNGGWD